MEHHLLLFALRFKLKITLQQAAVPPLAGFPVRNFYRSIIRSLTPQQAAGNALAIAVQQYPVLQSDLDRSGVGSQSFGFSQTNDIRGFALERLAGVINQAGLFDKVVH